MSKWEEVKEKALRALEEAKDHEAVEKLRIEFLGKKGEVAALMQEMRNLSNEERPAFGKAVNELKDLLEEKISAKAEAFAADMQKKQLLKEKIDISLDAENGRMGQLHPLTIVQRQIEDIFIALGYSVVEGPEVEIDLYNFERANTPKNHPARDMQDTFYVDVETLLRTQTTAIQMRALEANKDKLPIKVICPGKTYRRDDDDATHSHQFTQMEGLVVGEDITLADLKGTLDYMAKAMFGKDRSIRLRPSYFPFTEPSIEADVSCFNCNGKGCRICKGTGWIEILGAGMVHPNVLEMAGIDSKKYTGFAFGVGIERVAMLKYGIDDIRNFYTNDVRFLKDFNRFE